MNEAFVYILGNSTKSALYIGATNNLKKRLLEHKGLFDSGFSKKYHETHLFYFDRLQNMNVA